MRCNASLLASAFFLPSISLLIGLSTASTNLFSDTPDTCWRMFKPFGFTSKSPPNYKPGTLHDPFHLSEKFTPRTLEIPVTKIEGTQDANINLGSIKPAKRGISRGGSPKVPVGILSVKDLNELREINPGVWYVVKLSSVDSKSGHAALIIGNEAFEVKGSDMKLAASNANSFLSLFNEGPNSSSYFALNYFDIPRQSSQFLASFLRMRESSPEGSTYEMKYKELPFGDSKTKQVAPSEFDNCSTALFPFVFARFKELSPELTQIQNEMGISSINELPNLQFWLNQSATSHAGSFLVAPNKQKILRALDKRDTNFLAPALIKFDHNP